MILGRVNDGNKDYFLVKSGDGVERVYTGKGLFVIGTLQDLIREGYEVKTYDYQQISKDGKSIMELPSFEVNQIQKMRADSYEINACSAEQFADLIVNTNGSTSAGADKVKVPQRNISITTREQFIEFIDALDFGDTRKIKTPINYFVSDDALYTIGEVINDEKARVKIANLARCRQFTYGEFVATKAWLENILGITINTIDDFTKAYYSWGIDGVKCCDLELMNVITGTPAENPLDVNNTSMNSKSVYALISREALLIKDGKQEEIGDMFESKYEFGSSVIDTKLELRESTFNYAPVLLKESILRDVVAFGYTAEYNYARGYADYNKVVVEDNTTKSQIAFTSFTFKGLYNQLIDGRDMTDKLLYGIDNLAYQRAYEINKDKYILPKHNNLRDILEEDLRMPTITGVRYLIHYMENGKASKYQYVDEDGYTQTDETTIAQEIKRYLKDNPINTDLIEKLMRYGLLSVLEGTQLATINQANYTDDLRKDMEEFLMDSEVNEIISAVNIDAEGTAKIPDEVKIYNTVKLLNDYLKRELDIGYLSKAKLEIQSDLLQKCYGIIRNYLLARPDVKSIDRAKQALLEIEKDIDFTDIYAKDDLLVKAEVTQKQAILNDIAYNSDNVVIPRVVIREPSFTIAPMEQRPVGTYNVIMPNASGVLRQIMMMMIDDIKQEAINQIQDGRYYEIIQSGLWAHAFEIVLKIILTGNADEIIESNGTQYVAYKMQFYDKEVIHIMTVTDFHYIVKLMEEASTTVDTFISHYDLINNYIDSSGFIKNYPLCDLNEDNLVMSGIKEPKSINFLTAYYSPEELLNSSKHIVTDNNMYIEVDGQFRELSGVGSGLYSPSDDLIDAGVDIDDLVLNPDDPFTVKQIVTYWAKHKTENIHIINKFDLYAYRTNVMTTQCLTTSSPQEAVKVLGNIKSIEGHIETEVRKNKIYSTISPDKVEFSDALLEWLSNSANKLFVAGNVIAFGDDTNLFVENITKADIIQKPQFYRYQDLVLVQAQDTIKCLEIQNEINN